MVRSECVLGVLWDTQMEISKNHYDLKFKREVKTEVRDLKKYSKVEGYSPQGG